ncbi:MAG: class I SAM-dependent methyltransferase [Nannocystis sp.]|nr:class I SAM-dependent methyltransferase [Nannocystis sp.]MBA3550285.1 class I SAM-dependent methyltransferase [Nannocystis sp.]
MHTTNRQAVVLGGVSETLMIPLWCRAIETERRRGILSDPKAREIVARLDYDFERRFAAHRDLAFRACLRTVMIDRWAQEFLRMHPGGTVVEIGTGLNTRFERIDNGTLRWFDVDLADSMALRRRFFADTPRRTMIEGAFGESEWLARLASARGGPYLFIAEAVLVYLSEATVRRGLDAIATAFPGSLFVFDTVTRAAIASQQRPMMNTYAAPFVWGIDDVATIEAWGAHRRLDSTTMFDLPAELRRRVPLKHQLALPYLRLRRPELLRSHALHRFELRTADDAA